MSQIQK